MSTQYDPNRFEPGRGGQPLGQPTGQPVAGRAVNDDQRTFGDLLSDLVTQLSTLFRKEIQLARAEMSEKVSDAGGAIPGIAGGAALGFGALIMLLMAASALVARLLDIPAGWGFLIVGVVAGLLGFLLIRGGISKLKATNLTPTRTAEQLSRDAQAAKETVR